MDNNDRVYCNGEEFFSINDSTELVIKSFWDDDDYCADGFVSYADGTNVTFGCVEMCSPKEWFVPTYFEFTDNFVAICFLTGNRIGVERIFDVLARRECLVGSKSYDVAVNQFKKDLVVKKWSELNVLDQTQIRNRCEQSSTDKDRISSFSESIQNQIQNIHSSKEADFEERVRNLEVLALSLATVEDMDSIQTNDLIESFLVKPKQKRK